MECFLREDERDWRRYLRNSSMQGEWADHLMVRATAETFKCKIRIISQGKEIEITPMETEKEITVGFVSELH